MTAPAFSSHRDRAIWAMQRYRNVARLALHWSGPTASNARATVRAYIRTIREIDAEHAIERLAA